MVTVGGKKIQAFDNQYEAEPFLRTRVTDIAVVGKRGKKKPVFILSRAGEPIPDNCCPTKGEIVRTYEEGNLSVIVGSISPSTYMGRMIDRSDPIS